MFKLAATVSSVLVSLGLAAFYPPPPPDGDEPPPPKHKEDPKGKKGDDARKKEREDARKKEREDARKKEREEPKKKDGPPGAAGDLRRAYDLLRRLRSENSPSGRSDDRLREWTERAVRFYRDGLKAYRNDDERLAHEYGALAHDLARAVDHARNAARLDQTDPDLPPPPDGRGPDDAAERVRRDLRRVYDRIEDLGKDQAPEAEFYVKAAQEYYRAARRDAEAGRNDRAAELARAADAVSHVAEHVGHVLDANRERPSPRRDDDRDGPPRKKEGPRDRDLPPPLPE